MPEEKLYSFNELGEHGKTNAVFKIDSKVRAILGLDTGARSVDRPMIECIIADLDPTFEQNGRVKQYTKKYTELTKVLLKEIYDKCSKRK